VMRVGKAQQDERKAKARVDQPLLFHRALQHMVLQATTCDRRTGGGGISSAAASRSV
jgi:hypothetical protein